METKIKTRLYEAFAKRVSKTDEKLSVSILCEKAGVSRASFYIHFKSIDDFETQCRNYIIEKIFEQIYIFMKHKADPNICQRILSDTDIKVLKYFTNRHTYWDFASSANRIIWSKFEKLMIAEWGEDFYESNKDTFEFALNGSVASLYFDLLDYDDKKFRTNMVYIANIASELFPLDLINS